MPSHSLARTGALREQVLHECIAMTRFAMASGMSVPPALVEAIEKARFASPDEPMVMAPLVKTHDQLARLIAPATPRALLAMGDEHTSTRLSWAGSVGLVRRMMLVAVLSVVAFVLLSLSPDISTKPVTPETADGLELLVNELFWMAAAAIGASFAMLRQVNDYIVSRTYDPKYEPTYWIKFILGVMAGFILAAIVPFGRKAATAGAPGGETIDVLAMSTLAMLGGFSASAVYRILNKLVESVENVFRSAPKDEAAQAEKAAQNRATEQVSHTRLNVASQIVRLQQEIASGADTAKVTEQLQALLQSLVPATAAGEPSSEGDAAKPAATVNVGKDIPIVTDAEAAGAPAAPGSSDDQAGPDEQG